MMKMLPTASTKIVKYVERADEIPTLKNKAEIIVVIPPNIDSITVNIVANIKATKNTKKYTPLIISPSFIV